MADRRDDWEPSEDSVSESSSEEVLSLHFYAFVFILANALGSRVASVRLYEYLPKEKELPV